MIVIILVMTIMIMKEYNKQQYLRMDWIGRRKKVR